MTEPQPYKLMIKTLTKSKAKFLKYIPIKSFVEGEEYEIWFELENIGEEIFPGGVLRFEIRWPSQQWVYENLNILPIKRNEIWPTPKTPTSALSTGYGLVYIIILNVKDEQGRVRQVEFYSGKRVEDRIDTRVSIHGIKSKSWEEIYEFWGMIFAVAGLAIIALDKIYFWLTKLTA